MLEWQFQKRLQESKQSDEDEEEEDDEDMDAMLIMQRLEAEKRARVRTDEQSVAMFQHGGKQDFVLEEEVPLCHVRRLSGSIKPDFCFFQAALPISSESRNKSAALRSRKGESREN